MEGEGGVRREGEGLSEVREVVLMIGYLSRKGFRGFGSGK